MKSGRQKLGQHYLADKGICRQIVDAAQISGGEKVLEIGPGKGALTGLLYNRSENLTVVEPDRKLADGIALTYATANVINSRAESVDISSLPGPLVVVSNLPYYASVRIYKHCIKHKSNISRMVLMFQKEVASRIASSPGSRSYGSLSILSGYHWEMEKVMTVDPGAFKPAPKVTSMVLKFFPHKNPPVDTKEEELFRLVRQAFSRKRRTLKNNIKEVFTPESIEAAYSKAKLKDMVRAEAVSLKEFALMSSCLKNVQD